MMTTLTRMECAAGLACGAFFAVWIWAWLESIWRDRRIARAAREEKARRGEEIRRAKITDFHDPARVRETLRLVEPRDLGQVDRKGGGDH